MADNDIGPPLVSQTTNASAHAGADDAGQPHSAAREQRPPSGTLVSIRRRLAGWLSAGWLSSLEGPRKLAINGLVLIITVLGFLVVMKAALKQLNVIELDQRAQRT